MSIKLWKILCFLVVIVGATILVHPTQRDILRSYIDNGRYASAWAMIQELLADSPLDFFLYGEAVRLDILEGHPNKAIDRLEALNRKAPLAPEQLERLAVLYEWGRQPQKALVTWERLLEKEPDNRAALNKLIGYYRYRGDLSGESHAIVHLIRLEEADGKWRENGNRLTDLIALQLSQLDMTGKEPAAASLSAMLASGLFQLYEESLEETDNTDPGIQTDAMYRCLEQFVWAGHLELGQAFAERADRLWHTGIDQQLHLVEVLHWNRMDREALDLLAQLHDQAPRDRRIPMAMARISDRMSDPTASIALYDTLVRMDPVEPVYRRRLMALYLQTGQTDALFDRYAKLYATDKDPNLIHELLELAMQSGDREFQERALALANRCDANDSRSLKLQADLYLGLDQPEEAYPLLKYLATGPEGKTADLESMIQVAGYTNDPATIADALVVAEHTRPDDAVLLDRIAGRWLTAGRPANAYGTMRRLTTLNGNRPGDICKTLDMAWHTGDTRLIEEAAAWAMDLAPDDKQVTDDVVRLYLSVDQAEKAYALKAEQVRRQKDASQIPALLSLAESTGRLECIGEAIAIGRELAPNDADLVRISAEYYLAQSKEPEAIGAFERYLTMRPRDQKARRQLAQLYEWQNQPEKALAQYRQLLRQNPKNKAAKDALASLTGEPADGKQTLAQAKKMADANPKNAKLALAAGRALVAREQLEEGAIYLRRAADLSPQDTAIWLELADVYEWSGQTDRLVEALERLADGNALDRRRGLLLAEAYMRQRRWSQAGALLQPLTDEAVVPRREGLLLVEVYANMNRNQEAENLIQRLELENEDDPGFLADLGQQAQWRQLSDLALKIFESVLRQDPENLKALKGCGQIYFWTARPGPAIRFLKTYNRLSPEDHEARYLLGEVYLAVHRDAEAQKEFRMAKYLIDTDKAQNGSNAERSVRKGARP